MVLDEESTGFFITSKFGLYHITKDKLNTLCGMIRARVPLKEEPTCDKFSVSGHIPMCPKCKSIWAKYELTKRLIEF